MEGIQKPHGNNSRRCNLRVFPTPQHGKKDLWSGTGFLPGYSLTLRVCRLLTHIEVKLDSTSVEPTKTSTRWDFAVADLMHEQRQCHPSRLNCSPSFFPWWKCVTVLHLMGISVGWYLSGSWWERSSSRDESRIQVCQVSQHGSADELTAWLVTATEAKTSWTNCTALALQRRYCRWPPHF